MTEPQVWTVIAVFTAAMFSMMGLVLRTVKVEIGAVVTLIDGFRSEMKTEIKRLDNRIDSLHSETVTRFEAVNQRLDVLDRDVGALAQRVFHQPE